MTEGRKPYGLSAWAALALILVLVIAQPAVAQAPAQAPAQQAPPQVPADYVVGPLDELQIFVFGETDLSQTVTVRPDGKITIPLVGDLLVAGLTVAQVGERLAQALKTYLRAPHVTVTLIKLRPDFVYLVGQFKAPGAYEIKPGWTVMEAIAQAGGVLPKAALKKATLLRRPSQMIALDLDRLLVKGDQGANMAVQAGDVIMIPEFLNKVLVWGNVKSPAAYDLAEGARVLDALSAAGGPAAKAALKQVGIIRQTADGKRVVAATVDVGKILKGDESQNVLLQHADIVYVPHDGRITWQEILSYLGGLTTVFSLFGF
ncbi:MAG: polysaccharide biosynthesis/export family protein [bacterium]